MNIPTGSDRCRGAFVLIFVAMVAGIGTADAGDIYKWVDAQGRTHLSDQVPPEYQDKAVRLKVDVPVSDDQRNEANARAAKDAERLARTVAERNAPVITPPATTNGTPAPPQSKNDIQECARRWAEYSASQACFAPFRLNQGGIAPEASQFCTAIPDPSSQCGSQVVAPSN